MLQHTSFAHDSLVDSTDATSLLASSQTSSSMAAEVGENAIDIALKVARALTTVGAEYFLGGSLASSLQGEPRATNDIDFVISLPLGKLGELTAALGSDFEVDVDTLRDALLRASCANAFYLPVVTKIDFFGRGHEPFDESEFSRRRDAADRRGVFRNHGGGWR